MEIRLLEDVFGFSANNVVPAGFHRLLLLLVTIGPLWDSGSHPPSGIGWGAFSPETT
jgi:hypothetical protein